LARSQFGKVNTPDGIWDAAIHGDNADGFVRDPDGGAPVTASELAQEIRDAGWQEGQSVRLLACRAACGSGAQDLANELNTTVYASTRDVHITGSGKIVLWDEDENPVNEDFIPFEPQEPGK
jgi:hypothetical protein